MTTQPTLPGIPPTVAATRRQARKLERERVEAQAALDVAAFVQTLPEAWKDDSGERDLGWYTDAGPCEFVAAEGVANVRRAVGGDWWGQYNATDPARVRFPARYRTKRGGWRIAIFSRRRP